MSKVKSLYLIIKVMIMALPIMISGCDSDGDVNNRLDVAESLMESYPDSALSILQSIDFTCLKDRRIMARHSLLHSMALDKNRIDTTTFEILQPAIDFYLNKNNGNADDKLRTYYYQSVIYKNAGDSENAMQSHLKAFDIEGLITDSLTLARLLVAQGSLYYRLYRIDDVVYNNVKAADIFGRRNLISSQLRCYARALNGEVILRNRTKADSIYNICETIIEKNPQLRHVFLKHSLVYGTQFEKKDEIKKLLEEVVSAGVTDDMKMNVARAFTKIGEPEKGLMYLEEARVNPDDIFDSLTYWSVKSRILEDLGDDVEALYAFRNYSRLLETYHTTLFNNELLFSEKKHNIEMENIAKIQKRDKIIKWISIGTAILVFLIGSIYYRYRINKAGRLIAEQNAEKLQLTAEKLQLETEKLQLEAENLQLEVGRLEDERERLSKLLELRDGLSDEAMKIIRERLEMLNGLLAKEITNEEGYAKQYRKYVDIMKKDRKKFQKSLRKDLQATYPHFFADLENHGLTEKEVDYVCLFAIGLRGKEIGAYLEVAGHYNISSEIRRKLGLDSNGENLGPYLRSMLKDRG